MNKILKILYVPVQAIGVLIFSFWMLLAFVAGEDFDDFPNFECKEVKKRQP